MKLRFTIILNYRSLFLQKTYNHIFKQNGGKFNFHFKTPEGDIAPGHTFSKINSNVRNMILSLYNFDINREVKLEPEQKENELAG
jgi:hypothetical protein